MGLVKFTDYHTRDECWIDTYDLDEYVDNLEYLQERDKELERLREENESLRMLLDARERVAEEFKINYAD